MSYKDGIPLLTTLGDEGEDSDDYIMGTVTPRRRCKKRHLLFGVVLCFAAVLVIGLGVSVTLGITLKKGGQGQSGEGGHGTGGTASGGGGGEAVSSIIMTMPSYTPMGSQSVLAVPSSWVTNPSSSPMSAPNPTSTQASSSTPSTTLAPSSSASLTSMPPAPQASSSFSAPLTSMPQAISSSSAPQASSSALSMLSPSSTPIASLPLSSETPPPPTSTQQASAPTGISPSLPGISPSPSYSLLVPASTAYEGASSTPIMSPSPTPFLPTDDCLANDTLCPSPNDNRVYKFDTLANGLNVVMISDPATDLSGASMAVAAGSFNDPKDHEGLAHFCEHMLFLGTKKYPQENIYSNYLSTHGGYDNAYTSTQETNYHFRVNSAYLEQPLDMFAHFFIDPLLSEDSTASEMYAVNQEHEKNLHSDPWKLWQLLKHVSNPAHPFSQFSTGNFETLNKSDVNDQLMKYYYRNYVAKNMFLAVYGRENTSVLLDWITTSFANISSTSDNNVPATYNTTAFPVSFAGKIVHYHPEASTNTLTLFWQTLPLQGHRRNSVSGFLQRYLGHEGQGSLFGLLERRGLASAIVAGVEVEADSFQLFSLQITLTESGLDNVSKVVRAVFHYTHLLASMTESEFAEKWADFCQVEKVNFDYAENESPNDYAVSITSVMRVVKSPADVLPNPRRYQPDYALTINTAKQFTPNNTLIFIGTHQNNSAPATPTEVPIPSLDSVEPIYGTPFHNATISDDLLAFWTYSQEWDALYSELALAGSNTFVPEDFTVHLTPPGSAPSLRTDLSSSETWVLPDTGLFPEPRASFTCELRSGCNEFSALREALSELFAALATAKLKPRLYGASEVGYTFKVESTTRGLMLTFAGLSDSAILQQIISDTMNVLVDFNATDDGLYDLVMSDLVDQLTNYNYTTLPYRYTSRYLQLVVLERPYWTHEKVLSAMQNLSLTDVLNFANTTLLRNVSVSCLAHGNVDNATADKYSRLVTEPLATLQATPSPGFIRTRIQLPMPSDYGLSLRAFNPVDENSVVSIIFQAGPVCKIESGTCSTVSVHRSLYLSLLRQVIADECFTQLRTNEKLGYVVFCFDAVHQGIGSFQTVVQSQVFSPEHVLNSTMQFLDNFYVDTVMSMNFTEDFNNTVQVLRETLTKRDLKLEDKTDRIWAQVMSGQHQFDFRQQQIHHLDDLTAEDFAVFYNDLLLEAVMWRRLVVVVYGEGKEFDLPVEDLVDYQNLDQSSTTLPTQDLDT